MVSEMASLVHDGVKPRLLFYVSHAGDPQRMAVGPALAAVAEAAGWGFDCYYDDLRRGRHFGGGNPESAPAGTASGSFVAGGRHAERLAWLAARFELTALGDPECVLWPALEAAGVEALARSADPAALYEAAFARLGRPVPLVVLVLDAAPQGDRSLVVAPYLYPSVLAGEPTIGLDVSSDADLRSRIEELGAREFRAIYVDKARAIAFPGGLDSLDGKVGNQGYASLTAALAERHASWGRGVLLGDPALVAAQLARARRLRLLPLYGRPQTDAIQQAEHLVRAAREPVYGRQYDDHDFLELARLGHGLQVLDPDPPFDAGSGLASSIPSPPSSLADAEPDDAELEGWAEENRVLVTLLFWSGMVRELHCLPPLLDLAAATGLRAGLIITAETIEHADGAAVLSLLAAPLERGGVLGLLEPLLASTGRGVAAETLMPKEALAESLAEARAAVAGRLPVELQPKGWWPLLDAPLVSARSRRLGWRSGRPVVRFSPHGNRDGPPGAGRQRHDLRERAGQIARRLRLEGFFEERRPFENRRPGPIDEDVAAIVQASGFEYMWTKASFGRPAAALRRGEFVALPFTAGNWDGWSPFYTLGSADDLARAERRLLARDRPGWLASTIDSPLWTLPGELLERGADLYRIAELAASGGRSGRLVNVTPNVVARYSRLLGSGPSEA